MKKKLMKGNQALAEGAIRAGCRFYAGYPITPQTEIVEYMSDRMLEVDGNYVQAESEIGAISMVYGAASCGYRAMTSSSGPGFVLKQEGISYIASAELPAVIINVQRIGSGLGDISPAQDNYILSVKGGGHGDYRPIVYAPSSVQENLDYTLLAFEKAEQYRTPVVLLSDGAIGQMMESVRIPDMQQHDPNKFEWALKGKQSGKNKIVTSNMYYHEQDKYGRYTQDAYAAYGRYLADKVKNIQENEQLYEEKYLDDADVVLVSYGISSRICKAAIETARKEGIKLGLIRPISLFPFPNKAFDKLSDSLKGIICVEMNSWGQMVDDIKLAVNGRIPVHMYASSAYIPDEDTIIKMAKEILNSDAKEVL
ncbi:3-methyl-2-oxobutanoate dehydrogenase subunit VorB [Abyssisolibacter fermentans]|uniref:3-methyl-2-oxobutanoate dehydrogenase subunit VorB n=1 Tax=Abyssisolibacter fermentans TaxID=1766203 RepID=UPI00083034B0|nr:3-methyl-2-oxobutanoate dehydrogenase subunit VorB [Abyssisolibacter fermentans]